MARANGLSAMTFTGKLTDMSINNQVTWGMGAGDRLSMSGFSTPMH